MLSKAFAHIKKKMAPPPEKGSPTKAPSTSASLQDMAYSSGGGGGGSDSERKLSAGTDSVASSGMPSGGGNGRGRRRASMQDALDHTKINASLYDQDSLRQQPSFDGIQEESHGSLNLALRYNWEQALLTVRINQARDLVPRSAISNGTNASTKDATTRRTSCTGSGDHSTGSVHNSANPYCRVSVLPSTTVSHVNTKVHKHTLSPEFEEEFLFEVAPADLNTSIVQVRIMDHDSGSTKHVCLGITTVQLCDVDLVDTDTGGCGGTAAVMWKNIFPYRKDREQINYGEVMFSMGYLPSAERLTVVIQKARNLRPPEDGKTTANPYIKASLLCAGGLKRLKKKKTSTKRSCLNPVWNEALVFSVGREQLRAGGVYLEIAVHTDNILIPGINNDCIGKVALGTGGTLGGGVGGFCGSDEMTHWTDMLNASSVTARWHRLRPPENA